MTHPPFGGDGQDVPDPAPVSRLPLLERHLEQEGFLVQRDRESVAIVRPLGTDGRTGPVAMLAHVRHPSDASEEDVVEILFALMAALKLPDSYGKTLVVRPS